MESKDENNEEISLPPDTLAILQEFLENKRLQESFESNSGVFEEDWQLSQFWYNDKTVRSLSKVCLSLVLERHSQSKSPSDISVALLSCPSLYSSIKKIHPNGTVRLFEYDTRFSVYSDFVFYDYKDEKHNEINLREYENYFDIIICDPPFLSQECIESTANIIKRIRNENSSIVMCSGQTAKHWIEEFLQLNLMEFRPEHEKNLANEFCAYANFDLDKLLM